ncbi:MAG: radical SAM protein [Oligoflexia bacterium]|nr:radical SAM protein [Oligoflexia bacterium]MBF0367147.1 radical SAM protein [Oligoflexia bacterium]
MGSLLPVGEPLKKIKKKMKTNKLRLSITDQCQFSCLYCRGGRAKSNSSKGRILEAFEIVNICQSLVKFWGIDEIRITGGEPTLRKDLLSIVEALNALPLRKLAITTNGLFTPKLLSELKNYHCNYINFSLDSLREDRFREISRGKEGCEQFKLVRSNIEEAIALGFKVRINCVLLRGVNDDELPGFMDFSREHGVEVRFLELIRIGKALEEFNQYYIPAKEVEERIYQSYDVISEERVPSSTAYYLITKEGAKIGFITPESCAFCNHCTRLRLDQYGNLRTCLMDIQGINLAGASESEICMMYPMVMEIKEQRRHAGRRSSSNRMDEIGG